VATAAEPPTIRSLRTVRRARGLTLREVARTARVDAGALSRIERGQRNPTTRTLRRILEALDLNEAAAVLAAVAGEERP
jgi:transcriptional regulator with XRE-family HTH domain